MTDTHAAYRNIMVPVDMGHTESLERAVDTAADLARLYGARMTLVGITASGPTFVASTPQHYRQLLVRFAEEQSRRVGIDVETRAVMTPDPRADLHRELLAQVEAIDADLVVMASHVPGLREYLISSNAGHLAAHAGVSVFVVR